MNRKRIFALAFAVLMVLSLAACGTRDNDKMANGSGNGSAMTGEPKTAEEALALHKELLERENALLSENTELWEKVFMEADKGMAMIEDGKNYGDFLLDTVEAAKEQFTDKEYEWLKESATEISNIENKLTALEEKYPEIVQQSMDGDMSMPAGSDTSNPPDDGSMQKFPAFEGKDLDGNAVKSDELFSGNAVTVVNFWFTTCNPCVGELSELDALNKELAKKGGSLIGVNTFTLDGDEAAISEAKDVLAKKGATYQNVYFDSDGEAGKFTTNIFAYQKPAAESIRDKLTAEQYRVTQESGTERAFTGEFWDKFEKGIYVDVVTGEPLFSSTDKFESGCGWPAFTKPIEEPAVVELEDLSHGMRRTEVRSRAGDSHLGHLFTGDPESRNGVRYCINSASLRFVPYAKMKAEGYGYLLYLFEE